jgi:hypothetical protein
LLRESLNIQGILTHQILKRSCVLFLKLD